jgi:hypothetical protein
MIVPPPGPGVLAPAWYPRKISALQGTKPSQPDQPPDPRQPQLSGCERASRFARSGEKIGIPSRRISPAICLIRSFVWNVDRTWVHGPRAVVAGLPPESWRGVDWGWSLSSVRTLMPSVRSESLCGDLRGWFTPLPRERLVRRLWPRGSVRTRSSPRPDSATSSAKPAERRVGHEARRGIS